MYPAIYPSYCGISLKAWATDRVVTRSFIWNSCEWFGYLFWTWPQDYACSLTINMPPGTTVRTVLLSVTDKDPGRSKNLIVSVGETLATSTRCFFYKL